MEDSLAGGGSVEASSNSKQKIPNLAENAKRTAKIAKPTVTGPSGTARKRTELNNGSELRSTVTKSGITKAKVPSTSGGLSSVPVTRRKSTGGLPEKQPVSASKQQTSISSVPGSKPTSASSSEPLRRSLPEVRRSSLPSVVAKPSTRPNVSDTRSSVSSSQVSRTSRSLLNSDVGKREATKRSALNSSTSLSTSQMSFDSTGSSTFRRAVSKVSSPSSRSPSVSSGPKVPSLSTSRDRSSNLSDRKKTARADSRDSHFIRLPQVELKAGDDVRLDLRGHRIRSLNANGLNLSPDLEFVYLRDNLLSTLEGIEILKRVKVLDLSFNDFKGPGFEPLENCKALQQLYLAGNQITSLVSLPELPNLEFLSVAQNKLKSLSMASQPRLQVLAASKNRLTTLKGFPHLPALEHLRVEENPILKMSHLEAASILLVGPTLKKFNDRDLSRDEKAIAKCYPAHTSFCIREGWEFSRPEHAVDSTFSFLVKKWEDQFPPGYLLEEASVDQPFEEDACGCHFQFVKNKTVTNDSELVLKYQWLIGDRTPFNFKAIPEATGEVFWPKHEDVHKILKVECTPILGDIQYPTIFAISLPVAQGTGYPKVLKIDVRGELVEGNIIRGYPEVAWCGGTPGKGVASWLRRKWNSSPVVIVGAEDDEYQLTLDDVGSCLVYMYTPVTEEGSKGEPQYAITDYVKAAPPSVDDVRIVGDVVEGTTIRGVGEYFGGREGPSKFEWLRENKDTGEFELFLTGTTEYTLTKEDVGRRLAFVYIPTNFEGQEGKPLSTRSEIVKQAPPKATNLKIVGDLREASKVTVTCTVTGGAEGSSRVQWFKTSSSVFEDEKGLEAVSTSKIAKAFRIPLGAVGYYIVAKFTPMTVDGESGEHAYAIAERAVETLPPSLNFLSITGEYSEGGILTASYGYIGGHEGKSLYNWYIHEIDTDSGTLIPEASGSLQYRLNKDAIGKFVSFTCTPIRDDLIVGEPKTFMGQERVRPGSPRLLSLQIAGIAIEGNLLRVDKKYWGGDEGQSTFRWFRTRFDGTQTEIKDVATSSYMLSGDDIGYCISVSCEPVRTDWARGPTVLSELTGPVVPGPPTCQSLAFQGSAVEGARLSFIATYSGGVKGGCLFEWFRVNNNGIKDKLIAGEYLDLTLEDVGGSVLLVYTPVRKDGVKGSPTSILSTPVTPADPVGIDLVIPNCCQNEMVVPQKTYFGGQEGEGKYIWYRSRTKLEKSVLEDMPNVHEDLVLCGNSLEYTPSLEDVDAYLALYWLPTRADGISGNPLVSVTNSPVSPALPVVSNVHARKLSSTTYSGEGEYFGGYEGESLYSWYRESDDGKLVLTSGADCKKYEVTDADYGCRLLFGYTPIRSDSLVGELRLSEPTEVILPEPPIIEMLALAGKAVEGDVLTAVEVIPKSETQQHVWEKYKKEIRYQWFFASEMENINSFEQMPSQCSCSYKLRFEDIGRRLQCECIVSDVFGRSSEPAYVKTTTISAGFPKIDKLEIEGRGFHTNLYAVRGTYSGGKEGKSRIQWLRSMAGSPDLISIPGETGRMYEANVDDVGYRLVAIYTPVREDGVEGQPVSASTDSISVEPDVLKDVKQKLESAASVKFETLCDKDRSSKKVSAVGTLERRILEVSKKKLKVVKPGSKTSFPNTEVRGSYAPPFHVEVFRNDQHRLKIVVDGENEVDLMVQTRHMRDVIVLVIRGLAQKFNSTSLNSLLKIEA
ncbi:187-kDa microtubule-associated protein AIR9 isoform X1 [Apium graveolens]|uniref:187-kDa microtubule-associated protein AIR9 isoform X1 n=1 Tax=Apium graveolens TaxID=4045 RepID=UPI003D795E33